MWTRVRLSLLAGARDNAARPPEISRCIPMCFEALKVGCCPSVPEAAEKRKNKIKNACFVLFRVEPAHQVDLSKHDLSPWARLTLRVG